MLSALEEATSFTLVTAFASVAGVAVVKPALSALFERGGQGRVILAVDRRGFNAAAVFETLLAMKESHGARMSIGVVLEDAGLLHAKALFTQGPRGDRLLVGSANLTRGALSANHELGVLLHEPPADVRHAFHRFVTSIAPRSLDGPDARAFLQARGLLAAARPASPPPASGASAESSLAGALAKLPALPPLEVEPEAHLAEWVHRGYIVGRGRRSLDALVLRLPQEQLVRIGLIRPPRREELGPSSHETRTMGYGVDLIPTGEAEQLRRDAKRVSLLLAKLTLNLPCFGLWMPETYWDAFLAARETLRGALSLAPARVRDLAAQHRGSLTGGGLESAVDQILARLEELDLLITGKRDALRAFLVPRFHAELVLRTPDVLASCIELRIARQRWAPYDQTDVPYRQLMVDIVQAAFAATYRTGDWPHRFRSYAARQVAAAIGQRLAIAGREANGETAMEILDLVSSWEDAARPMHEVVAKFRSLVGDDLAFPEPELDELAKTPSDARSDDGGDDDDDI